MTLDEVKTGCEVALKYDVASVCCKPCDVKFVAEILKGSDVLVGTVVGFPHGSSTTESKVFETKQAVADGAVEIDVVINIGHLKSGKTQEIQDEISAVVAAAAGNQVKVILENAYLTDAEKVTACKLIEAAGAHYVKTSTGFAPTGATLADVKLMRATCSPKVKVKSAGGVKSLDQLLEFLDAGIDRSGSSSTASILDEFISKYGRD
jgi:deoxyribose-phosphate aldolase